MLQCYQLTVAELLLQRLFRIFVALQLCGTAFSCGSIMETAAISAVTSQLHNDHLYCRIHIDAQGLRMVTTLLTPEAHWKIVWPERIRLQRHKNLQQENNSSTNVPVSSKLLFK